MKAFIYNLNVNQFIEIHLAQHHFRQKNKIKNVEYHWSSNKMYNHKLYFNFVILQTIVLFVTQ